MHVGIGSTGTESLVGGFLLRVAGPVAFNDFKDHRLTVIFFRCWDLYREGAGVPVW